MIIPVIVGPTGIGKTELAISLAKKIDGEVISADSMQIYESMDIGTGKATKEEMQNIQHYMLDIRKPYERYTAKEFKEDALKCIEEIIKKGKTPIIVGGTGLYINSLVYDYTFDRDTNIRENNIEKNKEEQKEQENNYENNIDYTKHVLMYRKMLEEKLTNGETTLEELYKMASKIDPVASSNISPNDKKRILRILELDFIGKEKVVDDLLIVSDNDSKDSNYDNLKEEKVKDNEKENNINNNYTYMIFMLNQDRKKLYEKIEKRIDKMLDLGLVSETKKVVDIICENTDMNNIADFTKENMLRYDITAMQAIGYKEPLEYLKGNISYDDMVYDLKLGTRHYAKRQLTWFRKLNPILLDKDKYSVDELVKEVIIRLKEK